MRRTRLVSIALAGVATACQCGSSNKLHEAKPDLQVVSPLPSIDGRYVIDFGGVQVGGTPPATGAGKAQLTNKGDGQLTISSIDIDPSSLAAFRFELPTLPVKVPAHGNFAVSITFQPPALGKSSGKFTVKSDDPKRPSVDFWLIGRGIKGSIVVCDREPAGDTCSDSVLPANLLVDFGGVDLSTQATRTLVVKNVGSMNAHVLTATLAGDPAFTVDKNVAPAELKPGEETSIVTAGFKPMDGHPATATYTVESDDLTSPRVVVDLKGLGKAPALCPDAGMVLDFGKVQVGATKDLDWTFSSCGTDPLILNDFGTTNGVFTLVNPPSKPVTMPAGQKGTFTVRFTPTQAGPATGFLNLKGNAGDGAVQLLGTGSSCTLAVTPNNIDFGTVPQGGFTNAQVAISNTGDVSCHVTAFNGPTPDFSLDAPPALPFDLAPGSVQTLTVKFAPTSQNAQSSQVEVIADGGAKATVTLAGSGGSPKPCDIHAVPASVSFGVVPAGSTGVQQVVLHNFGTSDCTVLSVGMKTGSAKEFTAKYAGMLPDTIASGATMTIETDFLPIQGGNYSGDADVSWMAGFNFGHVYVPLAGTGGSASICVTPASIDFGSVTVGGTATRQVTISSCGQGAVIVKSLSLVSGSSKDFSVPPLSGPQTLVAGTSMQVNVTFKPKVSTGQAASLSILSNDTAKPDVRVPLVGNMAGACDTVLSCNPAALKFPQTDVGQTSALGLTCVSAGTQPVTITSITMTAPADYALFGAKNNVTLQPGQSIPMSVRFTPAAAGAPTGSITVVSNDCRGNQVINISGTGKNPTLPPCTTPTQFSPVTKWEWKSSTVQSGDVQIFMTPIVANLSDDNGDGLINSDDTPDVVIATTHCLGPLANCGDIIAMPAYLRALDGATGAEKWTVTDQNLRVNGESQPAIADVDNDNVPDILIEKFFMSPGTGLGGFFGKFVTGYVFAFNADGSFKWVSDPWTRTDMEGEDGSAISIADLDGDGWPEILVGNTVYNHDGSLRFQGKTTDGAGENGHGQMSVAADLDGDGILEVIAGNTVYRQDGTIFWQNKNISDGICAVIDIDQDGHPEVVVEESADHVAILNGLNGSLIRKVGSGPTVTGTCQSDSDCGSDTCSGGKCTFSAIPAPFVAADFDGDGQIEIAIPMKYELRVFKTNNGNLLWTAPINDNTGASGASAFDFEGDGHMDIVFGDEQNLYVFDGANGTQKYKATRGSMTGFEIPVIADVDNDGHADILTVSDHPGGIKALSNTGNNWVGTLRIWNQHAFRGGDGISESAIVPVHEVTKWKGVRYTVPRCQ